jgi:hypothetical protein
MIFAMIVEGEDHGFDLLVWVELRGFEPLTPSMRTKSSAVHPDNVPCRHMASGDTGCRRPEAGCIAGHA